jgi:acetylornithine/succinyldiaminopimelate/putrescine aminotransferase
LKFSFILSILFILFELSAFICVHLQLIIMKFREIETLEEQFQVATYAKMNIAVERGRGAWIWTSNGEKYLDLYGGHAVCATGHSHPHVVEALKNQAEKVLFYSNLVYSDVRARAAEKLISIAPENLTKAFFCNSGTEANENAMRMARMATAREKIITFAGGFHGRTADSISATFLGKYREIGRPNVPHHVCAEFGDIESVKKLADRETAAIMLEPIQSMAGVREAAPRFFKQLREICDERGIVLIFDEVQTGVGRTGKWFFAGSEFCDAVEPDIISLAKSLGSGVPVGACLVNEPIAAKIKTNDLGTTFGGGMLAMSAVLATLEAIGNDSMLENAKAVEKHLREELKQVPSVVALHGKGCLLGIEFKDKCAPIHQKLLENKIITGTSSNPNVLRLLPPLCVKIEEIDLLIDALGQNEAEARA